MLRIRPTFLMLFLALVVPVSALSLWLTLRAGQQVSERLAQESIERAHSQTQQATQMLLGPITAMLGQLAHIAAKDPDLLRGERGSGVLLNSLTFQDDLAGVFIGQADQGGYHMALKVAPSTVLGGQGVPASASRATRHIERAGPNGIDRYVFWSGAGEVVDRREGRTAYDPRQRPWYRQAVAEGHTVVSDPYVFATTGAMGVTVSTPVIRANTTVGVVGADLTLEGLTSFLARHRASPNATTLLLDREGQVVAHAGPVQQPAPQQSGTPPAAELGRSLEALADKGPATAWLMRSRLGKDSFSYEDPLDGRRMMASFLPVPIGQGMAWQVMILAPRTDFSRDLDTAGRQVLGFLVGALLLQVVLIYSLLPWITRPLEKVARVQAVLCREARAPCTKACSVLAETNKGGAHQGRGPLWAQDLLAGRRFAWARSTSRRMLEATNSAKGTMFSRELASSKAAMYSLRRSSSMTVHGYPPESIMAFIRKLPIRPLPSG